MNSSLSIKVEDHYADIVLLMLCVNLQSVNHAECQNAQCCLFSRFYCSADCLYVERRFLSLIIMRCMSLYKMSHYAYCHCGECHGTLKSTRPKNKNVIDHNLVESLFFELHDTTITT
jgi:hypothetical protein